MAAVDRARLARQVEHVAGALEDPPSFRARFGDLMEFYADRTRRPAPHAAGYGVAAPVVKALETALLEKARTVEQAALLADVLWSIETRESRLIALFLIRAQPSEDVLARVVAWSGTTRDPYVLQELAGPALMEMRRKAPASFLEAMRVGRSGPSPGTRSFALRALAQAVADRSFQALPEVLELLAQEAEGASREDAQAHVDLVVELARRTPGETARVLREALERHRPWSYRLAAAALPELPERTRASLQRSLSASRAAGIMPRTSD
jgi:DNA alkylation repair enzyme